MNSHQKNTTEREFTQNLAYLISGMFSFSISTIILDTNHNSVDIIQYNVGWLITWKRKRKELNQSIILLKIIMSHKLFIPFIKEFIKNSFWARTLQYYLYCFDALWLYFPLPLFPSSLSPFSSFLPTLPPSFYSFSLCWSPPTSWFHNQQNGS